MYGIEARHDITFYIDTLKSGWLISLLLRESLWELFSILGYFMKSWPLITQHHVQPLAVRYMKITTYACYFSIAVHMDQQDIYCWTMGPANV